jgi:hypothetical protein
MENYCKKIMDILSDTAKADELIVAGIVMGVLLLPALTTEVETGATAAGRTA